MKNLSNLTFLLILLFCSCSKDAPTGDNEQKTEIPAPFTALAGLFDGNGIGAAVDLDEEVMLFFNMDGDQYAWYEDEEVKAIYDLQDANGPLSGIPLSSVGAAGRVAAYKAERATIYFVTTQGDSYCAGRIDNTDNTGGMTGHQKGQYADSNLVDFSGVIHELRIWGPDDECPFSSIGAMHSYTLMNEDCFDFYLTQRNLNMFNGEGNEFVRYWISDGGRFYDPRSFTNQTAENNCGGPDGVMAFESIAAAGTYLTRNINYDLFFSEDGKSLFYYRASEGIIDQVYPLY